MRIVEAIGLGLLQGATEFLPISSSGHLLVARTWLRIAEPPLLYDVLLHVSTLLVICFHFRQRLITLFRATARMVAGRAADAHDLRLLVMIASATAATAVVGLLISRFVLDAARTLPAVSIAFIATAVLLAATRLRPAATTMVLKNSGLWLGLAIGLAQGLAVLPGISRAGVTIAVCLFASVDQRRAGEIAFLVSVPAVLGALAFTLSDAEGLLLETGALVLAAGFAAALVAGALCLRALLLILRQDNLAWFATYLLPLGILGLIVS